MAQDACKTPQKNALNLPDQLQNGSRRTAPSSGCPERRRRRRRHPHAASCRQAPAGPAATARRAAAGRRQEMTTAAVVVVVGAAGAGAPPSCPPRTPPACHPPPWPWRPTGGVTPTRPGTPGLGGGKRERAQPFQPCTRVRLHVAAPHTVPPDGITRVGLAARSAPPQLRTVVRAHLPLRIRR